MNEEATRDRARLERRLVAGVGLCAAVVLLLVFLLWLPLRGERAAARLQLQNVEEEARAFDEEYAGMSLSGRLDEASVLNQVLGAEWEVWRERAAAFGAGLDPRRVLPAYEDGRIDYKVALFEARARLAARAEQAGVSLPESLGVPETIGSDERAEVRLWQLAVTVNLVELALEAGLPAVTELRSYPPVVLGAGREGRDVTVEFDVGMRVAGPLERLVAFLDAVRAKDRFYVLRWVRIERQDTKDPARLEASFVLGGVLLREQQLGGAPWNPVSAVPAAGPRIVRRPLEEVPDA